MRAPSLKRPGPGGPFDVFGACPKEKELKSARILRRGRIQPLKIHNGIAGIERLQIQRGDLKQRPRPPDNAFDAIGGLPCILPQKQAARR